MLRRRCNLRTYAPTEFISRPLLAETRALFELGSQSFPTNPPEEFFWGLFSPQMRIET